MDREKLIIATTKSWNIRNAHDLKNQLKDNYNITIFNQKEELNYNTIKNISPKYIFFPHWSWIIQKGIYENFNCIVFHMTDLPFGRGGSPLQNLIVNKVYNTKISAIRVDNGIDTGKIYLKEDFHIDLGNAEEIFQQASKIIFKKMIPYILKYNPVPHEQKGEAVSFKRRKPEESDLITANIKDFDDLYDFIRMLDGEGYPNAFIRIGNIKILLKEVHIRSNKLVGRFEAIEDYE